MVHIKKYIMAAVAGGLIVSALPGCTKTEEIYIADLYRKAYITTDIYPQTEGQYTITTTVADASFVISGNRLVKTGGGESVSYNGIKSYKVYFRTNYAVDEDLTGTFAVPADADELVNAYNSSNGYSGDEAFKLLAPEYYTITNGSSTIPAGRKEGEIPFSVELSDNLQQLEVGNYMVPIACTLEDGTDVELSENLSKLYLKFSKVYSDERTGRDERILYNETDFAYETVQGTWGYSGYYLVSNAFNDYADAQDFCYIADYSGALRLTFNEPVYLSRLGIAVYNKYSAYGQYANVSYTLEGESEENAIDEQINITSTGLHWFEVLSWTGTEKRVQSITFSLDASRAYGYSISELYVLALNE